MLSNKQRQVIKESAKHSIKVAYAQYKDFTKENIERRKRAKQSARLVQVFSR